jgi:plasmid stabilization system protein ParE
MIRQLIVRAEAEAEIDEAAGWYEARSAGLGLEFLRAVDAVLSAIRRSPDQFPVVHREARRAVLRRFPYSVLFSATETEVTVHAAFHFRRDPTDWTGRLG